MSQIAESSRVSAARAGDEGEFRALVEPYRRELLAHCYRMLGTPSDAEDLVQETMLRAWRHLDTFRGESSFRAWLYKIATNASLNVLAGRKTRTMPTETHPPAEARAPIGQPSTEHEWLEPIPDALIGGGVGDAEDRYLARESVALAFLIALQRLPPRQRAVLLLRDVLGFSADEAGEALELTVASVESLLARARTTLAPVHTASRVRRSDEGERALLDRYVRAWESGDVGSLVALLREDATLVMPPVPSWFLGRASIHDFLGATLLAVPGSAVRLIPVAANRQPAFAVYSRRGSEGPLSLLGVQLVEVEGDAITGITTFVHPLTATRFGLAMTLEM